MKVWSREAQEELKLRIEQMWGYLSLAEKKSLIDQLEEKMSQSSFWDDPKTAQDVTQEVNRLRAWLDPYNDLKTRLSDVMELYPEAKKEQDLELLKQLDDELEKIEGELKELELKKMLSNPMDERACFLSVNAGAGGTESCDWVDILVRMYERWASKKGWKVSRIDRVEGEVAGSKSITLRIEGSFAYGYCKSEHGVHRLVRISPFDSQGRRHTSFASVEVLPMLDESIELDIRSDDLRIETYRASGAGGQHVNKTDSAVRITHLPTQIVVSCQSERSQLQNKETCMRMLHAKLYELEERKRQEKMNELKGEQKEIAWGSQIRSYVFQPYTLAKDLRTQTELGDIQAVMNGEIDVFVEAFLKQFGGQV